MMIRNGFHFRQLAGSLSYMDSQLKWHLLSAEAPTLLPLTTKRNVNGCIRQEE